jgi:hypothetical protein
MLQSLNTHRVNANCAVSSSISNMHLTNSQSSKRVKRFLPRKSKKIGVEVLAPYHAFFWQRIVGHLIACKRPRRGSAPGADLHHPSARIMRRLGCSHSFLGASTKVPVDDLSRCSATPRCLLERPQVASSLKLTLTYQRFLYLMLS